MTSNNTTNSLKIIKIISALLFVLVFSLSGISLASAAACPSDLTVFTAPTQITVGDTTSLIKLRIQPPGSPIDVWKSYANATLSLPNGLVNLSDTFKNLVSFAQTTHSWSVNATQQGTFEFNVSVINDSGVDCTNTVSVNAVAVKNVNLSIALSDLTTLKMNQAANVDVTLNNSGTDPAFNIDENLDSIYINETRVIPNVAGGALNISTYTFTPTSCGTDKLITVEARNFDDGAGNVFPTISDSDTFDVIGSDLTVLDVALSSLIPQAGKSITAVATVKNENGTDIAVNGKVTFYFDIVQEANKIAEVDLAGNNGSNVSVNDEASANTTWTVNNAGNHTIIAVASSDNECPTSNDQRSSLTLTASAATVVDTTPAPSGGGGRTGGGTSAGTVSSISKDGPTSATKFFIVAAGTSANVRVTDSRIPVTLLQIDVANRVADVEISVTKLDKEPTGSEKIADGTGKVYSYIKVNTINLEDKDVTRAIFRFKVDKRWLLDNNYKEEDVVLARFNDGKWNSLSTIVLLREESQITYTAESPGFSTFAILARNADEKAAAAGEKKELPKIEEKKPEVKPIEKKDEKAEEKQPEVKQGESTVSSAITGAAVALRDTFVGKHPAAVGIVFAVLVALVVLSFWYKRMGSEDEGAGVKAASGSKPSAKAKKGKKKK